MAIQNHTQSREDSNNRAMLAAPTRTTSEITLRPISHGSLELLRQLNNSLATAEADMGEIDTRTLTEFLWVHGAPIDEVLDTVYNYVHQYGFPILPQNLIHRPRKHAKKTVRKRLAHNNVLAQSIEQRPQYINDRSELGHHEMDTVVGPPGSSGTMADKGFIFMVSGI